MSLGELKLLYTLSKQASGVVNLYNQFVPTVDVARLIDSILTDVYNNIANNHFQSAQDAFMASKHSNSPGSEIRSAIAHLRDAYFIYNQTLKTKIPKKSFLGLNQYTVDALSAEEKCAMQYKLMEIAFLIYLAYYNDLGEIQNANTWKAKAFEMFQSHANTYIYELTEFQCYCCGDLRLGDQEHITATYYIDYLNSVKYPVGSLDIMSEEEMKLMISKGKNYVYRKYTTEFNNLFYS